jgi:DNA-binding NarL/FixJ family response regulator
MAGMTGPARVLLVDDDALVRAGLSMMLHGADGIAVVGEAADDGQVGVAVDAHSPDVVLMDLRMPRVDGITATRRLRERPHPPEVIVLTTFDADENVLRALRAGASGFLLKDSPPGHIAEAIRRGRRRRSHPVPENHPPADGPRRHRGRGPGARPARVAHP